MLAATLLALSTGPSSATYRLVPVAASADGVVLLRTWRELNPTGAHAPQRVEVGWLAVSARGVWREAPHAVADPAELGGERAGARQSELQAEFDAPLDLARPPESLRPLLAAFGAGPLRVVDPAQGAGVATWSPARACARGKCAPPVAQRTIGGLESDPREGAAIRSAFFRDGVALFRNGVDGEGKARGARFTLLPNVREERDVGLVDLGYEIVEVDGIAIPGARPPAASLPVRTFAPGLLEDAPSADRARRLLGAPLDPSDREGVRLVKAGREAHPATCAGFLRLIGSGWEPGSTLEIHAAGSLLFRCGGLDLVARARPARESHVAEPIAGPSSLAQLPPCVGGMHASDDVHAAAMRASAERVSWGRFDPTAKMEEGSRTKLAVRDSDAETTLEVLAEGDIDGDGRQDLVVSSRVRATEGTWTRYGVYALTRRAGDPLFRVVAERSLFGANTCVAP
ncbi:MAG TPA: hypothetical protein VF875_01525 [Anaeromyxobacter sp.]